MFPLRRGPRCRRHKDARSGGRRSGWQRSPSFARNSSACAPARPVPRAWYPCTPGASPPRARHLPTEGSIILTRLGRHCEPRRARSESRSESPGRLPTGRENQAVFVQRLLRGAVAGGRQDAEFAEDMAAGDAPEAFKEPCTTTGTAKRCSRSASSGVRLAVLRAPL